MKEILAGANGLALIRGRWVEVDRERLERMMERFREAERLAAEGGLSFAEAMRMLAGADVAKDGSREWRRSRLVARRRRALARRDPQGAARARGARRRSIPGASCTAPCGPTSRSASAGSTCFRRLGLGACLADDMGLGKTIQVLSLLLVLRREQDGKRRPSLLVAPASLLANWAAEIERFAPRLKAVVAHPSAMPAERAEGARRQRRSRTSTS